MLKSTTKNKANCQIQLLPHEVILPNPHQPRVRFDYNELEGLAISIRTNGILQPINVRKLQDGKYELISGVDNNSQVVIAGQTRLADGVEVEVIQ